jgi:hypothetical protein
MAEPRPPQPVKLICGILTRREDRLDEIHKALADALGPTELVSRTWPFDQTQYYEPQMGADLVRQFLAFIRPVEPDALAEVKLRTNELEADLAGRWTAAEARPVNLDPGYVGLSHLVLASTKASAHRIYLKAGIYAELTLQFAHGTWQAMHWTYPDFRDDRYHGYLGQVRQRLYEQLDLRNAAAAEAGKRGDA